MIHAIDLATLIAEELDERDDIAHAEAKPGPVGSQLLDVSARVHVTTQGGAVFELVVVALAGGDHG